MIPASSVPLLPRWLGLAGLLPQLGCLSVAWVGPEEWYWTALAIGWGYAALIFSFLGGLWWGIAAGALARGELVPAWLWVVSVVPSLLAFVTYLPWVFGYDWPEPSLVLLGIAILATLVVDRRLSGREAPAWWWSLRVPLSVGLGLATTLLPLV
ncbi:DUF3429 domain-containing protein [Porphyrobacter sp. GA68]|uniref:DUF3429 domain-containing protein n=1 Tax=Porphyrobacter sp. GA68 TaxID=2883480 RepID=UPI001D19212A|nr:DUF3429 domain-containing protein [Porphyrobacter sp. GA68]